MTVHLPSANTKPINWAAFFGWFAAIIVMGPPLLFIIGFFLWMFPNPLTSPPFTTWVRVNELNAKVGFELQSVSHLTEYDRSLVIVRDGKTFKTKLGLDWGPAARINLYIAPGGKLALVEAPAVPTLVAFEPMRSEKVPYSTTGDDWRYIGSMDIVDTYPDETSVFVLGRESRLMYVPPSAQPECNAMFGGGAMDSPIRRASQAKNRCPRVAYVIATKTFKPYPPEEQLRELRERSMRALYQYRQDQRRREGKDY